MLFVRSSFVIIYFKKLPVLFGDILGAANLVALKKKDGGTRPIAVSLVVRRLISKMANKGVINEARNKMKNQVGCGTPGGNEATIIAIQKFVSSNGNNGEKAMLKVDFKNAFNTVSRDKMFNAVKEYAPAILPWVQYIYANTPLLIYNYQDTILSHAGTQQGDPLGPLLFCLVLHSLLCKIRERYNISLDLDAWYMDDGTVIGNTAEVLKFVLALQDLCPSFGLILNLKKCEIWWPSATENSFDDFPEDISRNWTGGSELLGGYIGTNPNDFVLHRVNSISSTLSSLVKLKDSQLQLLLLRCCAGLPKMMVALRTNDHQEIDNAIQQFDGHILNCLEAIIGCSIDENTRLRISLSISKGGLGISLARHYALSANLAALTQTQDLQAQLLNVDAETLTPMISAKLDLFNSTLPTVENVLLPQLKEIKKNLQSFLYAQVATELYNNLVCNLHLDVQNTSSLNAFLSTSPESGAFLFCIPIKDLKLVMGNIEFQMVLRHYLGLRVYFKHTQCNICLCNTNDPMGSHALRCHGHGNLSKRHDDIKRTLAAIGNECGISTEMETPNLLGDGRRPGDVYLRQFSAGKDLAVDITCIDALIGGLTVPEVLEAKAREKNQLYLTELNERGIEFKPFVLSLHGVFHKDALDLISVLGARWAGKNDVELSVAKSRIIQRISFCLRRIIGAELAARDVV